MPSPVPFDVLITGGRVIDGTGGPWFHADVGVVGDRIAAVGQLAQRAGPRRASTRPARSSPPASSTPTSTATCRCSRTRSTSRPSARA